jgi:hypothetical protein
MLGDFENIPSLINIPSIGYIVMDALNILVKLLNSA